jgi:hypothetical protein
METPDLTSYQQPIGNHRKEKTQPSRKENRKPKTNLRSGLNDSDSDTHVQGPSTCVALTTYHTAPLTSSAPSNRWMLRSNINLHTEFLSLDSQYWETVLCFVELVGHDTR